MTMRSFGASWGANPIGPVPLTARQKQDARSSADAARLAALPTCVRDWSGAIDLDALDALAEIARVYRSEGMAPVRVRIADLAQRLKTDEADAERRLSRLVAAGAVERTNRIAADPVFRPVACASVETRAVGQKDDARVSSPAAPGALIGMRHARA